MIKKFLALVLVASLLFIFSSCDSSETGVEITEPIKIAVTEGTADEIAGANYASIQGYELMKFSSLQASIIAAENKKADFVIINSDEATKALLSETTLSFKENIPDKMNYCAIMKKENSNLSERVNFAIDALKEDGTFKKIEESFQNGKPYTHISGEVINGKLNILCTPFFDNRLYYDTDGNLSGKEYEYIKAICDKMSVEPQIIYCDTVEDMFQFLEKGEGDIIISALTETEERKNDFLLSKPYAETTFGLYEKK